MRIRIRLITFMRIWILIFIKCGSGSDFSPWCGEYVLLLVANGDSGKRKKNESLAVLRISIVLMPICIWLSKFRIPVKIQIRILYWNQSNANPSPSFTNVGKSDEKQNFWSQLYHFTFSLVSNVSYVFSILDCILKFSGKKVYFLSYFNLLGIHTNPAKWCGPTTRGPRFTTLATGSSWGIWWIDSSVADPWHFGVDADPDLDPRIHASD
jgi:hypothetical protein